MKKIFIPWQLFRQTLVLRTSDHLESWLSRWRYADDGAILIGGAMSLREDPQKLTDEHNGTPAAVKTSPVLLAKPLSAREKKANRLADLDDRAIDCLDEL